MSQLEYIKLRIICNKIYKGSYKNLIPNYLFFRETLSFLSKIEGYLDVDRLKNLVKLKFSNFCTPPHVFY